MACILHDASGPRLNRRELTGSPFSCPVRISGMRRCLAGRRPDRSQGRGNRHLEHWMAHVEGSGDQRAGAARAGNEGQGEPVLGGRVSRNHRPARAGWPGGAAGEAGASAYWSIQRPRRPTGSRCPTTARSRSRCGEGRAVHRPHGPGPSRRIRCGTHRRGRLTGASFFWTPSVLLPLGVGGVAGGWLLFQLSMGRIARDNGVDAGY